MNIKGQRTTKLSNVKTVLNRGFHFTVVFENGKTQDYDFHTYDYFISR